MNENDSNLRELFIAACDLSESDQIAFVDEKCVDDPELRRELILLLKSDGQEGGIFGDKETVNGVQFQLDTLGSLELPERVGEYEIKKVLGTGGMGVVYLAEQQNPRRDVAVKVIRLGMSNEELLKRFELEADFLGRLTHPGIARIYEAGVFADVETGQERPFLAMEYVDGLPLRTYVEQNELSQQDKLTLLKRICAAIHHAHQRGVIHRDLKPGNVLVRPDGKPSVLDFGVARATNSESQITALKTQEGQLVGTVRYMSPEQVAGRVDEIDARSDVYSLGLIAYELLSGKFPYDLKNCNFLQAAQVISNRRPKILSSVDRKFRGDLNTVVMKAIEKDSHNRYLSAKAFGDDVQRFIDNQPVLARPATTLYQLKQFSKRNKTLVAGFLVSLALLVAGVIGTTMGMVKARNQAARTVAVNEFMKDILITEDKGSGNPNIKMIDVLREAAARTPDRFREYPELEAEVSFMLGLAFKKLTMFREAIPLLKRSYEIHESRHGLSHPLTRKSGTGLAGLMVDSSASETRDLAGRLLENTPSSELLERDALILRMLIGKACHRMNELDTAEHEFQKLLLEIPENELSIISETQMRLANVINRRVNRGKSQYVKDDRRKAADLLHDSIANATQSEGAGHMKTLQIKIMLADLLKDQEKWEESEKLCHDILETASSRFDSSHLINYRPRITLSKVHFHQNNFSEAAKHLIEAIERKKQHGTTIDLAATIVDGLVVLEAAKEHTAGEALTRFLIEDKLVGRMGGLENMLQLYLARFVSAQGRIEEAEQAFAKSSAPQDEGKKSQHYQCVYNLFMGEHKLALGDHAEASQMLEKALGIHRLHYSTEYPPLVRIQDAIGRAKEQGSNK